MENNVVKKVIELKNSYVKCQDFEMASKFRDIENSFTNSKFARIYIEPTEENFKIEIIKIIEYFDNMSMNTCGVRDLKLMLLLDGK